MPGHGKVEDVVLLTKGEGERKGRNDPFFFQK